MRWGFSALGDVESGGSALNRRRQQIGSPSKTRRSLSNATQRDAMIGERCRVLLIDDYEVSARVSTRETLDVRYMYLARAKFGTRRRDADSRLTWRVKYKRDARRPDDRARRVPLFYVDVVIAEIIQTLGHFLIITLSLKFTEAQGRVYFLKRFFSLFHRILTFPLLITL